MFESIFSKSILSVVLRGTNYLCFFCLFFFLALPISNFSKNRRFRAEGSLPPLLTPPNPPSFFPFPTILYPYEEGRDTPTAPTPPSPSLK